MKNERRQGLENQPYGRWFPLLFEAVFPKGHPYSWPVIGSQEDLTAATLDDVKEFFRTYYTPNNLSLVIAGDFDPAEAKQLVEKYFGDIPPGPALDRPREWIPPLDGEKIVEVNDRVSLERVYIGWPAPEYFSADDAALDIAARILADGLSSRLNKALVYDKQLATDVTAFNISGEIASLFVVQATARPGSSLAEIEPIVTAEIARLAKEGPTAAELDRAKTKQESEFISGLERIGGFGGKADVLNQYNTFLGDPGQIEADLARTRRSPPPRSARPSPMAQHAEPRAHPLPSGEVGAAVERPDARSVDAAAARRRPAVRRADGADERSSPTASSCSSSSARPAEGQRDAGHPRRRGRRSGRQGRRRQPDHDDHRPGDEDAKGAGDRGGARRISGTTLTGGAGRESARVSFDVLSRNLPPALGIVADVVQNPTFPEEEVARERKRLLDAIAQADRSGNALAARIQPMLAFGPDTRTDVRCRG